MRREKEPSKVNMRFFSLERLLWRVATMGRLGMLNLKQWLDNSLGGKYCLVLDYSYLVIEGLSVKLHQHRNDPWCGWREENGEGGIQGRWLSIEHRFTSCERGEEKRDNEGEIKDRSNQKNWRMRYLSKRRWLIVSFITGRFGDEWSAKEGDNI